MDFYPYNNLNEISKYNPKMKQKTNNYYFFKILRFSQGILNRSKIYWIEIFEILKGKLKCHKKIKINSQFDFKCLN